MPTLDFEPIGDRIVVDPKEQEEIKTASGLILSVQDDVNKEKPQCGEIVAVGTGGTFPDCPDPSKVFSVGEFVYFNRYAGEDIIIGNPLLKAEHIKLKVLRLDAILGRLKSPPKNITPEEAVKNAVIVKAPTRTNPNAK